MNARFSVIFTIMVGYAIIFGVSFNMRSFSFFDETASCFADAEKEVSMYKNVIIIPALNPPDRFTGYVLDLIAHGFERILLIDDGSDADHRPLFDSLARQKQVTVLRHAVNLGKGRALKDAFNYALVSWPEDYAGVITADSDGQHTVEDVTKISEALDKNENTLLLGTRDFSGPSVPFKSRNGNKITSVVFRLLYGQDLRDTQTGLRGIPRALLGPYMTLDGERFEYEMNMLIYNARYGAPPEQIFIQTVYFDSNSETHFRPFADSFKIYRLILGSFFKYILASLSSALLDLGVFHLAMLALGRMRDAAAIVTATVAARVISSLYNFIVNRNAVFESGGSASGQMLRYYTLCAAQLALSAGLVVAVDALLGWNKTAEKAVVDSVLFLISYQIQRAWVFRVDKR